MPSALRQNKNREEKTTMSDEVALVLYAAMLAIWTGALLWTSLTPTLPYIPRILSWDKLHHFSAYAMLMFLSANFFQLLIKKRVKGAIIAFIFTLSFGTIMEIGQGILSTSRHADWNDLLANTLGAALIFTLLLKPWRKKD